MVEPRDVPPKKAARRLHLTEAQFLKRLSLLFDRGFPQPDTTTGMYDLKKIDEWMDRRDTPHARMPTGAVDLERERNRRLSNQRAGKLLEDE